MKSAIFRHPDPIRKDQGSPGSVSQDERAFISPYREVAEKEPDAPLGAPCLYQRGNKQHGGSVGASCKG